MDNLEYEWKKQIYDFFVKLFIKQTIIFYESQKLAFFLF